MPVSLAAPPAGLSRARSTGINCQCAISRTILSETFSLARWAGAHPEVFLRGCRPDIAYQVGALTRVTHCFNDEHIAAARHLLRYLRTTRDLQLVCTRNPDRTNRQPEVPKFGLTPTTTLTTAAGRATTAAPPHGLWSLTEQPSAGARDVNSASHSLRRSLSTTQLQKQLKKRHAYGRFTTTWGT